MLLPGSDQTDLDMETGLQDDLPGIFTVETPKAEADRLKKDIKV